MKARQREQQIEAMDKFLNDPSKENLAAAQKLGVTKGMINARKNGEEYVDEVGIYDSIAASPSKIAKVNQLFRAFYNMAERAMKKLILSRDSYGRKLANVFKDLSKDDMKTLNDLLVAGDAERVDYSELSREERDALYDNAGHKEYDKARMAILPICNMSCGITSTAAQDTLPSKRNLNRRQSACSNVSLVHSVMIGAVTALQSTRRTTSTMSMAIRRIWRPC